MKRGGGNIPLSCAPSRFLRFVFIGLLGCIIGFAATKYAEEQKEIHAAITKRQDAQQKRIDDLYEDLDGRLFPMIERDVLKLQRDVEALQK